MYRRLMGFILAACFILLANCGQKSEDSKLAHVTDETIATSVPEGTIIKLKKNLNILPNTCGTNISSKVSYVFYETAVGNISVSLIHDNVSHDREISKEINLKVTKVQDVDLYSNLGLTKCRQWPLKPHRYRHRPLVVARFEVVTDGGFKAYILSHISDEWNPVIPKVRHLKQFLDFTFPATVSIN